jgi:hypothetical protein
MDFPLTLLDISLWFVSSGVILIVTSELLEVLPEYYRRLPVDKKRLNFAATGCLFAFLVTFILQYV